MSGEYRIEGGRWWIGDAAQGEGNQFEVFVLVYEEYQNEFANKYE